MTDERISTRQIHRPLYRNYLKKAQEFYDTMNYALQNQKWNAAALNAIHCGIGANDALLVRYHGIRCASKDHGDAVRLLLARFDPETVKQGAGHLTRMLKEKSLVEYEEKLYTQVSAIKIAKHAERFLSWARSMLER